MIKERKKSLPSDSSIIDGSPNDSALDGLSKETKRISKLIEPFESCLQKNQVTAKPFISLLKEHSKIKKAPKTTQNAHLINKQDTFELVKVLVTNSNCQFQISEREFKRASCDFKNIIFTFFALEYPYLMHLVSKDNFKAFYFSSHLYEVDALVAKWNSYVDEIQMIKNQTNNIISQEISSNSDDNVDLSSSLNVNNDSISMENIDDLLYQIDMYDDPFTSYNESI